MVVDVAPVLSALADAGVAVAAVGLSVLLVACVVSIWKNLQLIFGFGSSANLRGAADDWEVTDPETGRVFLQGVNEDGTVWEQPLDGGPSRDDGAFDRSPGVSAEEFDSWDSDRQNQYEIDRLNHELGPDGDR